MTMNTGDNFMARTAIQSDKATDIVDILCYIIREPF